MEKLLNKLRLFNQEHLLCFWNELTSEQQFELYNELDELDLDILFNDLMKRAVKKQDMVKTIDFNKSSINHVRIEKYFQFNSNELNKFEQEGLEAIANGQLAIILMAGGLSTRLSISYPKGIYSIDLPSCKSLYQLQAERILRIQTMAKKKVFILF